MHCLKYLQGLFFPIDTATTCTFLSTSHKLIAKGKELPFLRSIQKYQFRQELEYNWGPSIGKKWKISNLLETKISTQKGTYEKTEKS